MSSAVCAVEMEHCLVAIGTKNTPSLNSVRRNCTSRPKSWCSKMSWKSVGTSGIR